MERTTLAIDGMSCGHCVARVSKALEGTGARVDRVEIGSATVEYDPAVTSPAALAAVVSDAGYAAHAAPVGSR